MSKIRGSNTNPELMVFRELRRRKIYFQKHYRIGRISIDVALPKKKIAVFVDGDFWHGRDFGRRQKKLPKIYWRNKIATNITRDKKVRSYLRRNGWRVLRVWESDVMKAKSKMFSKIEKFLSA